MAVAQLVYKPRRAKVGSIEIDATLEEDHSIQCQVPDSPVEEGMDVADTVIRKPNRLRITGIISNTPIHLSGGRDVSQNSEPAPVDGSRAETAYQELLALIDARLPFTVVTTLREYSNMMFEDVSIPRNAKLGDAVKFSGSLKQLTLVRSASAQVPTSALPKAAQKKDKGTKTAVEAPKPYRGIAKGWADKARGRP